jgi:hypothetical protein
MAEMVMPAAASGKKLYARKSSGLVRTIGVFGAMSSAFTALVFLPQA